MGTFSKTFSPGTVQFGSKLNPPAPSVEPEITAYIAGLTTPLSSGQITKLDTFVKALKTGLGITALSDAFDVMYVLGGETAESSLRNLVKNAHHAETVNSPTFTALEGFNGNGTDQYIDTKYNPSTQGVNFTLNNCSVGVYIRNDVDENKNAIGSSDSTNLINIQPRRSNKIYARLNTTATTYIFANSETSAGVTMVTRDGAAAGNLYSYKNKTNVTSVTGTGNTTLIPDRNILILANTGGSVSINQLSFAFCAKHITTSMRDAIVDAIEAYMDSNGKGVIS
jgi:hypothetical protein